MPARPTFVPLFQPPPAQQCGEPISPRDIVITGSCTWPRFKVLALVGGKAWLQDVDTGEDTITDQARCRKALGCV